MLWGLKCGLSVQFRFNLSYCDSLATKREKQKTAWLVRQISAQLIRAITVKSDENFVDGVVGTGANKFIQRSLFYVQG